VESSEDAIISQTPAGLIHTWNRAAETVLGYSVGEIIGQHVSILVPPDRLAGLAYLTEQVLQGHAISQYDGVCLRKDRRRVHVSLSLCPIKNAAGEVVATSCVIRDISERHEAEQARALVASIVESSDDAIKGVGLDGTLVSWNRGAEGLFGYSSEEIIGKHVSILVPPGHRDELTQNLGTIAKGNTVSPFDTVRQCKDGRKIDVTLSMSPIRNPAGEVVGASAIAHDIGQRVRAEQKLRESDELFRGVFEHAPFGMCVTGLNGRFLQVNAAYCQMLGYSEQELLAKAWTELVHPDHVEPHLRRREQLCEDPRGCVDAEVRHIHRNGSVVWGRVRVSLVRDDRGSPLYCVVHVEDITERKRAEELFGYSSQEIIGKNVGILVPPGRGSEVIESLRVIRKGCTVGPFDTVRQSKDDAGSTFRSRYPRFGIQPVR